jgi:type IV secretion system protein VirB10
MPESKNPGSRLPPGNDPRLKIDADELDAANTQAMPQVARSSGMGDGVGLALGVIGVLALGALTWVGLSDQKPRPQQSAPPQAVRPAPPPSVLPPIDPTVNPVESPEPQSLLVQPPVQAAQPTPAPVVDNGTRAPALIIDNSVPASQQAAVRLICLSYTRHRHRRHH